MVGVRKSSTNWKGWVLMLRVLIIDDHPLFQEALSHIISRLDDEASCLGSDSLEQATTMLSSEAPFDLILLDLGLPGASGLSGILAVRGRAPTTPVVVVSAIEDPEMVERAASFGVSGYLTKSSRPEALHTALARILAGDTYFPPSYADGIATPPGTPPQEVELLTPRQLAVLRLLGEAKSNKQIAYELSISQETVKIHISAILRKLKVSSRAQAVLVSHQLRRRN